LSGLGVDLLFVPNGFAIAHDYEGRLAKGLTVSEFMAIRLSPLDLLSTTMGSGLTAATFMLVGARVARYRPRVRLTNRGRRIDQGNMFRRIANFWDEFCRTKQASDHNG
jgi:hypothetical protein